ncbi:MAG: undecaprenyl-diphosphate phosphatase [Tannerellaceae bacterium]|nr:undecaprenyl-diphosphate phosphatase [Tannerellaceae bacterium]
MSWLEALILGIIQGLTEFLPVSGSGHLTIGSTLFGINGEENLTFNIIVHAATVSATIVVLHKEIIGLFKGLFKFQWNEETQMVCKLLLSAIPVGIVGLVFKKQVEALFGSGLLLVGCMLLVTACLLAFAYYAKPRQKEEISFKDALIIGLSQACAIFPGLSRSGTTIATGILLGDKKEKVAKFSFLMVIIPVLGESFLDLAKGKFNPAESGISGVAMVIGFVAAFVVGAIACKWMISIVAKGKLIYFSYYCIAAGLLAIMYSLT